MSLLLFFGVAYLRSSVLAGRCLPAVLTSTCGAIASTAGVDLSLPPVAPADVPAMYHPRIWDIYLRCYIDIYLRCYHLRGGRRFEYTSGGSCGRACIIPPKSRGHLPPVGQRCLPAVLLVFISGGFAYTRRE